MHALLLLLSVILFRVEFHFIVCYVRNNPIENKLKGMKQLQGTKGFVLDFRIDVHFTFVNVL